MEQMYGCERAKIILEGQNVEPKRTLESGYKYIFPDLMSACKDIVSGKEKITPLAQEKECKVCDTPTTIRKPSPLDKKCD
jgi:hypothetical protein